jgi:polysaccharide biosynthesis protein PslJ
VSTIVQAGGPVVKALRGLRSLPHDHGSRPELPGWPVTMTFVTFPVSWALGLGLITPLVMTGIMAALLLVRGRLRMVPGVMPWLAFCVWLIPCALMLDSSLRLVGYSIRTLQAFAVAVLLIYVVNAARVTIRGVVVMLTILWVAVVIGGYLGMLFPDVRLTTLPGLLAPPSVTGNEYVRDLFFPPFAEVQEPWGAPEPFNRPAAPFPYANNWGGAIAMLSPVALAAFGVIRRSSLRVGLALVMVASVGPMAASSNRGMFLALAIALAYVAVRLAARGHLLPFLGLGIVGLGGAMFYAYGGASAAIAERQEYSNTSEGRSQLYVETITRTLESPVLGFGAPRPSYNLHVSVGTQGHVWMLLFSYGFVGLALFLWFLYGALLRTWRAPGTVRLLLHGSLVASAVKIFYYGLDVIQMMALVTIVGVLLRERSAAAHPVGETRSGTAAR